LKQLWRKKIARDIIWCTCFSPGGGYILIGSNDRHVYLVDLNGDVIWSKELDRHVHGICFSPWRIHSSNKLRNTMDNKNKQQGSNNKTKLPHSLASILWYGDTIIVGDEYEYVYFLKWNERGKNRKNL